LMHGIGKIGIGEAILRKPGKLTADEFEQIKKHPEIAQQIISKVQFLTPIVPMILYHQESWDGSGYPAGLKGEEIPLGSRIVAVINAFDAMVSERPYRQPLSESQAVEELKRGAGSQFDPKVVEAFLRVAERCKAGH
jgi:HD-GYP domain-containing protein (c-di-GMP phosphodiesterase class II)